MHFARRWTRVCRLWKFVRHRWLGFSRRWVGRRGSSLERQPWVVFGHASVGRRWKGRRQAWVVVEHASIAVLQACVVVGNAGAGRCWEGFSRLCVAFAPFLERSLASLQRRRLLLKGHPLLFFSGDGRPSAGVGRRRKGRRRWSSEGQASVVVRFVAVVVGRVCVSTLDIWQLLDSRRSPLGRHLSPSDRRRSSMLRLQSCFPLSRFVRQAFVVIGWLSVAIWTVFGRLWANVRRGVDESLLGVVCGLASFF